MCKKIEEFCSCGQKLDSVHQDRCDYCEKAEKQMCESGLGLHKVKSDLIAVTMGAYILMVGTSTIISKQDYSDMR
jgi:threonine dehydrogenase-like Zn-dependent dehydrogenase